MDFSVYFDELNKLVDDFLAAQKQPSKCSCDVVMSEALNLVKVEEDEKKKSFMVGLPGLDRGDINIRFKDSCKGRAIEISLNLDKDSTFFNKNYKQVLMLGEGYNEDSVTAKLLNGILYIDVFKVLKKESKSINIL